jgi:hypothetical protein
VESIFAAMQKTFVALKDLSLEVIHHHVPPVVSDSFLGGSAPNLRRLSLTRVPLPFPVLRDLLLAAPNLVMLSLYDIPQSAYFSPEEMVTCLSALTRLEHLSIEIKYLLSRPHLQIRHPPPTRSVLPALTELTFTGLGENLEDLVTRIDAPLLNHLLIRLFNNFIIRIPQLVQFISRTPTLKAYDEAYVIFSNWNAAFVLPGRDNPGLELEILCTTWQLPALARVCTSSFIQALIPMLEHLYVLENKLSRPLRQDGLEVDEWLKFFHPFSTENSLPIPGNCTPYCAHPARARWGKSN